MKNVKVEKQTLITITTIYKDLKQDKTTTVIMKVGSEHLVKMDGNRTQCKYQTIS